MPQSSTMSLTVTFERGRSSNNFTNEAIIALRVKDAMVNCSFSD